jgi:excinuclease ABC subunit C
LSAELRFEEANICKAQIEILKYKSGKRYDHDLPVLSQDRGAEMTKLLRRILKKFYALPGNYPINRIEGYDISNIQGKWATGSMVVFTKGLTDTKEYRKFKIKTKDTPDDPFMMSEMLRRRIAHDEWQTPNVILIDGGKTQLSAAQRIIPWNIPVVSLVKNPDRLLIKKNSKYYAVPLGKDLASNLLRSIRDESHRFAKRYHKQLTTVY